MPEVQDLISAVFVIGSLGLMGGFLSLAYVAERSGLEALRWLILLMLVAGLGMTLLSGTALSFSGSLIDETSLEEAVDAALEASPELAEGAVAEDASVTDSLAAFNDGMLEVLGDLGRWMVGLALAGFLLLIPLVRRAIARFVPIDPERPVHTIALQYGLLLILVSAMTGLFIGLALQDPEAFPLDEMGEATNLTGLWAQAAGFVLLALLGVGLGVARNGTETLRRLGLTRSFNLKWWLGMTLLGLAAGLAVDQLWGLTSPETLEEVETITDALFGPLLGTGWAGALTIGLSAGIGEELLFRGAAQPRFGIILTSLLFAAVHTQYSVSPALLQIFVIGCLLGLTRKHTNTTTAIGVHASYNFVLAVMAMCDEGVLSCPW